MNEWVKRKPQRHLKNPCLHLMLVQTEGVGIYYKASEFLSGCRNLQFLSKVLSIGPAWESRYRILHPCFFSLVCPQCSIHQRLFYFARNPVKKRGRKKCQKRKILNRYMQGKKRIISYEYILVNSFRREHFHGTGTSFGDDRSKRGGGIVCRSQNHICA